jgi:flagellar protein FliT
MNRLRAFSQTTKKLHELLHQQNDLENREETIARINIMIEKRAHLLLQIQPPFSEEEKELGEELIPINQEIQTKMNELFDQVKNDVKTIKRQKTTNSKYMNPYKNLSNYDGMFLDHKK